VRRWLYWAGGAAGVVLLGTGTAVAVLGAAEPSGPAGAVRGYFAALARGDAADALAYGVVPDGPRTLLTGPVLRAQQRAAPLAHFTVRGTSRDGDRARVAVRYVLRYPGSPQTVNSTIGMHRAKGSWRLDAVAIRTSLEIDRASQRATVAGAGVPDGDTLLFPGAVPISFDTPYLQLDAAEDTVSFGRQGELRVYVEVSRAGRAAMLAAVRRALTGCLTSGGAGCPLPTERYVPGSVRGPTPADLAANLKVALAGSDAGVLEVDGQQPVHATAWRKLTFANRAVSGSGTVVLQVHAQAYAKPPLRVVWSES
jgi:hypothetical protein